MTEKRFSKLSTCLLVVFSLALALAAGAPGYPMAFPSAEGFGANAVGGRGGQVIHVTNLNDTGPGSFRAAVEASGPRIVVFDVSGTIYCDAAIAIKNPYLTIAGQTAPSPGVTVAAVVDVYAHDVIVRHLRVAPGNPSQHPSILALQDSNQFGGLDAWGGGAGKIFDHCSIRWSVDDSATAGSGDLATYQHCLIAEGLNNTGLPDVHSKGFLVGWNPSATFHHNIIAKMQDRNPYSHSANHDFVNNLVYDWYNEGLIGPLYSPVRTNFVGNYYQRGLDTRPGGGKPLWISGLGAWSLPYQIDNPDFVAKSAIYLRGNIEPVCRPSNSLPEEDFIQCDHGGYAVATTRLDFPVVATTDAFTAKDYVLAHAGATVPERDVVDTRLVKEIATGTGKQIGGDVAEVGGYPKLAANRRPEGYDTDQDGMPDAWEKAHGLGPKSAADGPAEAANGYTNVENFLNELAGDTVWGGASGPK